MIRRIAAVVAATGLLLTLAVPVMAGGWADIVADGQTTTPREGGTVEIGFRVMQHGVTPAPWETATVHLTNASTGTTFDVVAKNDDPNGHFVATATMPEAGTWTWTVSLANLQSEGRPVTMTVLSKSGAAPAVDAAALLTAIERAKQGAIREVSDRIVPDLERLQAQDAAYRSRLDNLDARIRALTTERDALATRVGSLESTGGLPILAVVCVAVLAGAAAGFAMTWLARGSRGERPAVTLSATPTPTPTPTPRGVDPV